MRHEFQFSFDVPFIKAALRRDVLWKGYLGAGLLLVLAVLRRWQVGHWEPWVTGILAFGACVCVWQIHAVLDKTARRACYLWSKQSPSRVIRYELDDEGFDVVLEHSRSRHSWKGLRRLWRYDDVWLIEIVKMCSVFFPPDQVPKEVTDYITERCRAFGVRV